MPSCAAHVRLRPRVQVSYFYDPECFAADGFTYGPTAVYYGFRHPMKPHRIGMTHSLLMNSAFWPSLQVRPARSSQCKGALRRIKDAANRLCLRS